MIRKMLFKLGIVSSYEEFTITPPLQKQIKNYQLFTVLFFSIFLFDSITLFLSVITNSTEQGLLLLITFLGSLGYGIGFVYCLTQLIIKSGQQNGIKVKPNE